MSKLAHNKKFSKIQLSGRKKHVETMFVTNKQKNYPFYFKPSNVKNLLERNRVKLSPSRGVYYLRSLDSGYLTIGPLKAIIRLYKWFIKNHGIEDGFKYRLFVFPDFVLTSKPKEVRMGKGKGAPDKKVSIVKRGQLFISLTFFNNKSRQMMAVALLKKMMHKLPFRTIITANF